MRQCPKQRSGPDRFRKDLFQLKAAAIARSETLFGDSRSRSMRHNAETARGRFQRAKCSRPFSVSRFRLRRFFVRSGSEDWRPDGIAEITRSCDATFCQPGRCQ